MQRSGKILFIHLGPKEFNGHLFVSVLSNLNYKEIRKRGSNLFVLSSLDSFVGLVVASSIVKFNE